MFFSFFRVIADRSEALPSRLKLNYLVLVFQTRAPSTAVYHENLGVLLATTHNRSILYAYMSIISSNN